MDMEKWALVRHMYEVERLSKSQIAAKLMISRARVRRLLARNEAEIKRGKKINRGSKLDKFKGLIKSVLEQYPGLSAVRICEKITESGYDGKETILREYLRDIRGFNPNKAFLRIESLPGEQSQCDWGYFGKIAFGSSIRPVYCFAMLLCYSRYMYVEFTVSMKLEDFLRCHVNAFKYFGGVTKQIVYDNLKSVVLSRYAEGIQYNPKFMDFAGHYLFKPVLCNKGAGWEKGKVEAGIKYVRNNFWKGRNFNDIADINMQGAFWRDNTANQRIHRTTRKKPAELFKLEKFKLLPLPAIAYDTSEIVPCRSTKDCRVYFDGNAYSIPFQFVVKTLTIKANLFELLIYHKDQIIARHSRCWEKGKIIENPKHIGDLVKLKAGAHTFKLRDEFLAVCPEAETYFAGLVESDINLKDHLEKLMSLVHQYDRTEVAGAIAACLPYKAFGAQYVENVILQRINRSKKNQPIGEPSLTSRPDMLELTVQERNPEDYDKIITEKEADINERP